MKIPVAKPHIDTHDKAVVMKVLNSNQLALGPYHKKFESEIAHYVGSKYACSVSNGTAGLHLAVRALGLKEGDEVITTPFSFISSSNCLLYEKIKPVFVDIEESSLNIDPKKIEIAITKKTKAILVVHIFGQSCDMDPIKIIAKKHNLAIIEDACESIGALYKNKMTGTIGDIGVYAFYPNKQMTTGEGGMIVTDNKKLYDLCASMRNQGRNAQGDWLIHERLGFNYRMDEMSAALGTTQLKKLNLMIEKRRKIADWYSHYLKGLTTILTPQIEEYNTHTWFVYVIRVTNGKRDALMQKLEKKGIQTKPYLPVIHLQPFMRDEFGYKIGDYPIAEKIASQTLALPFYLDLSKNIVKHICSTIENLI